MSWHNGGTWLNVDKSEIRHIVSDLMLAVNELETLIGATLTTWTLPGGAASEPAATDLDGFTIEGEDLETAINELITAINGLHAESGVFWTLGNTWTINDDNEFEDAKASVADMLEAVDNANPGDGFGTDWLINTLDADDVRPCNLRIWEQIREVLKLHRYVFWSVGAGRTEYADIAADVDDMPSPCDYADAEPTWDSVVGTGVGSGAGGTDHVVTDSYHPYLLSPSYDPLVWVQGKARIFAMWMFEEVPFSTPSMILRARMALHSPNLDPTDLSGITGTLLESWAVAAAYLSGGAFSVYSPSKPQEALCFELGNGKVIEYDFTSTPPSEPTVIYWEKSDPGYPDLSAGSVQEYIKPVNLPSDIPVVSPTPVCPSVSPPVTHVNLIMDVLAEETGLIILTDLNGEKTYT